MSITTTFDFNTPEDYVFDPLKIAISNGAAEIPSDDSTPRSSNVDFSTDVGFTYDNTKVEFVGSTVRQKAQSVSGAVLVSRLINSINPDYGPDVTFSYSTSSAPIGYLDISSVDAFLQYTFDPQINIGQTGCMRIRWTPNYSGSPSDFAPILYLVPTTGTNNEIYLFHGTDGNITLKIVDNVGSSIYDGIVGAWSPISATEYLIELDFDLTAGETRVFIDGNQIGSTITNIGTRDMTNTIILVGGTSPHSPRIFD